jgi:hypothetical protein
MKTDGAGHPRRSEDDTGGVAVTPGAFGLSAREARIAEAIAAQVLQLLSRSGRLPDAEKLPSRRVKEMPSWRDDRKGSGSLALIPTEDSGESSMSEKEAIALLASFRREVKRKKPSRPSGGS